MQSQNLNDLIVLYEKRYKLIFEHVQNASKNNLNGTLFNKQFLHGEYLQNIQETILCYRNIIVDNYLDFHKEKVIVDENLLISLDIDTVVDKCEVCEVAGGSVAAIEISLSMFFLIDLCATFEFKYDTSTATEKSKLFSVLSSDYSNRIYKTNLAESLTDFAQSSIIHIFSSGDEYHKKTWARIAAFSNLWLFYHEIGHYLCGHCSFTTTHYGAFGISESKRPTNGFSNPTSPNNIISNYINWAIELQADWYATFRLIYHMQLDLDKGIYFVETKEELNQILVVSCTLPLTYALISSSYSEEEKEEDDDEDDFSWMEELLYQRQHNQYKNGDCDLTHLAKTRIEVYMLNSNYYPPEVTRLFNLFACLHFACFPLRNVNFDVRRNPIKDFGLKYLNYNRQQDFLTDSLQHFIGIFNQLNRFSFKNIDIVNPNNYAKFIGSILGSREAVIAFEEDDFIAPTPFFDMLLAWQYIVTQLCSEWNMYFSTQLKPNWTTKKGYTSRTIEENIALIDEEELHKLDDNELMSLFDIGGVASDPVYKVIDDWMSIICMIWHESERNFLKQHEYSDETPKDHFNFVKQTKKAEYYHLKGLETLLSLSGITFNNKINYPDDE